jgi:hypothetical protein
MYGSLTEREGLVRCHYAECRVLFVIMLSVIMLNVATPKTHPFLCKVRHHLTDNTFLAPSHLTERHSAEIGILGLSMI